MINKLFLKNSLIIGILISIGLFASCKKEEKKPLDEVKVEKQVVSPYSELLTKTPVYKDSVYSIYLTTIEGKDKILYLRDGSPSSIRQESKFFLHVYPTDKSLLGENKTGNLNYDFKNNATQFSHEGNNFYVSETNLPELDIDKINTGQYGYKGDGSINWRINKILTTETMRPIISQNGDDVVLRIDGNN